MIDMRIEAFLLPRDYQADIDSMRVFFYASKDKL